MPFQPMYPISKERMPYTFQAKRDGENGRVGCLMLHGFLGSPASSRPMAQHLAAHGITVHCPLLPGHGHYPDKLYKVAHPEWLAEAEEALATLRRLADEIFIIGHSMGSVLGARLVTQYRDIRGLVMITPLYDVPDYRLRLMTILRYVMPWFYPHKRKSMQKLLRERVRDFDPAIDFDDPQAQARLPAMTRLPTSGLAEMVKVIDMGRELWPCLDLPVLVFQSGHDPAVKPGTIQQIYDLLPSQDKQLQTFPEAGHELMRPFEPVHAQVWQLIYEFVCERSEAGVAAAV